MRVRRVVGVAAAVAVAAGSCLLVGNSAGAASTPPPPTPISVNATGMSSSDCPLPVGSELAFKPGTTVLVKSLLTLNLLSTPQLTVLSEAKTNPAQTVKSYPLTADGVELSFPTAGTYDLTWPAASLLGLVTATQKGKLVFSTSTDTQKCQVAVQVPVPSVSVPGVPSSVTGPVNGLLSSAVNGVNGALSPVTSAIGPVLGQVNGTVGSVTGGLTGKPVAGTPPTGSDPGTTYKPTGLTVAQRTVPQGYGSGSGAAGLYIPTTGGSINAPALGFAGTGKSSSAGSTTVKSGGSPHTVDLAASKPRSALDGLSPVLMVIALLALSGATAFYARTFLLHPAMAPAKS